MIFIFIVILFFSALVMYILLESNDSVFIDTGTEYHSGCGAGHQ